MASACAPCGITAEERLNHCRLTLLLFEVGSKTLREYFKKQWPIACQKHTKLTGKPWLNTSGDGHDLLWYGGLSSNTEKKVQSGDTEKWDLTILTQILLFSSLGFAQKGSKERKELESLRNMRNELCHSLDAKWETGEFTLKWQEACGALTFFGAKQEEFDAIENDIVQPWDDLCKLMQKCVQNDEEMMNAVKLMDSKIGLVIQKVDDISIALTNTDKKGEEYFFAMTTIMDRSKEEIIKEIKELSLPGRATDDPRSSKQKSSKGKKRKAASRPGTRDMVGYRVVRGPDWQWPDQDDGEGFLGTTVTNDDQPIIRGIVWVRWDSGTTENYRAGVDKDLRVFDSSGTGKYHNRVACDACDQRPLLGMRWKCQNCSNYDLCTTCYMADAHDLTHKFLRMDSDGDVGVSVEKREGATKIQARGIFPGARVVCGKNLKMDEQSGSLLGEGTVTKVNDWKTQSTKYGITVQWDGTGKEKVYRLGHEGELHLSFTKPATGGFYYRDHLPNLNDACFSAGDRVFVHVNTDELKVLAVGHGEWNDDMEKFMSAVGVVDKVSIIGDVFVKYGEAILQFNSGALTKVPRFKAGDEVLLKHDVQLVKRLQENHGGWNTEMTTVRCLNRSVLFYS